jgi:BirA family biotin operon repressor/biotin-[acetyl-CoA-carboxylase] ligase
MLIENSLKGHFLKSSVVGVGININQRDFNVENAVSLSQLFGGKLEINEVLKEILEKVEKHYLLLKNESYDSIKDNYIGSLFGYGAWETYDDGEIFQGKISGVDNSGHLEMCKQNGQRKRYELKQIRWLKNR